MIPFLWNVHNKQAHRESRLAVPRLVKLVGRENGKWLQMGVGLPYGVMKKF